MRIDLSVATEREVRDVAVTAPAAAPLRDVVSAVAGAMGFGGQPVLWAGDRPLRSGGLGDGALRPGTLLDLRPHPRADRAGVLSLLVVGGPAAGRWVALERGRISVGRDASCDLVLADPDVSRRHALVQVDAGITLRDLGSTNGTYVDGAAVADEPVALRAGSVVRIGDCLLTVAGPEEMPATLQDGPDGTRRLLRPPRRDDVVAKREILVPTPTAPVRPRGVQWVSALLPAAAGAALAWWAGSPQFLLFALLSPVMLLSSALGDRLHWRRSRRREAAAFRRARAAAEAQVAAGLAAETAIRRRASPDPATVARVAGLPSARLWSRRAGDADALLVRLGTGDVPATLRVREGTASRPGGTLTEVPVTADLRAGPLGLAGPAMVVDTVAPWLVGQLATAHSPTDVELVLLLGPDRESAWAWARWLPHLRGRVAATAQQWPMLAGDLVALVEHRRAARRSAGSWSGPWLVVVADRAGDLAELPGFASVLKAGPAVGVSALCVESDPGRLPAACCTLAQVRGETGTRVGVRVRPGNEEVLVVADRVAPGWAERLARDLAPLVDAAGEHAGIPPSCPLLEVLGLPEVDADRITRRWSGSAGGARAVLGRGPDGPVELDLPGDGPHALVAGTTGSGKSELLQTLVVSLAVNHPPDDVNFLLVDYKGGAAFAECARLPHVAGLVTDLDPYLTERALRSLDGELRRRERLLADAGAPDLAAYRAAGAAKVLPRLVIVVDEFAALAEELPDFVRGLIGVAQRGRSLGVHLVLATQRPGSAVSPEIRANTALRIALRVTDPGESTDVVGAPDAALIDRASPGRAYVRSGSALTCFQTAHASGATTPEGAGIVVEVLGPWRRRPVAAEAGGPSDLARLVAAIRTAAERAGRPAASTPWLPPLPERLGQAELRATRPAAVPLALVDHPDEQRQSVFELDLPEGESMLVAGAGRSGRTEALAAVAIGAAAQLAPSDLTLHVVDPAGALRTIIRPLPHVATALGADDVGLVPRLLTLLERQCSRTAPAAGSGQRLPAALLLVDGWDRLLAVLPDADAAACADRLAHLLRIGPAAGLGVVVSGDRSALVPRFSAGFVHKVLLRQSERSDFGLAGIPSRAVPLRLPAGRGLRADDAVVLQIAHAGEAPGRAANAATEVANHWRARGAAIPAPGRIKLEPLPRHVPLTDLPAVSGALAIGVAGDRADYLAIDPFAGAGRVLVAGPPRSGRTTTLCSLARQAALAGLRTVIAAPARSKLTETARALELAVIGPDGPDPGAPPGVRTLLLVDDCEAFTDGPAGERLAGWLRAMDAPLAAVVAGRSDDLATSYRGLGPEVRRSHCGILLRPGPVDGELLGVRLPRRPSAGPPGRGVIVGDPAWGPLFETGEPVPVQVATP